MTTLDVARPAPAVSPAPSVRQLARIEAKRFARHPVFLIGVALLAWSSVAVADDPANDSLGNSIFPAFCLGIFGFVVAHRLTRSLRSAEEAVTAAPISQTSRTGALLLACLVPTAVAALWLLATLVTFAVWEPEPWVYAGTSLTDRIAILGAGSVVAALGASLLGVATGRWLRFPGAGAVGVVVLMGWTIVAVGLGAEVRSAGWADWAELVRLTAPYTLFTEADDQHVVAWTGSPWWYLAYLLVLCAFAALAALLKGAGPSTRRTISRVGIGCLAAGVLFQVLAVNGGLDQPMQFTPDGSRTVLVEE